MGLPLFGAWQGIGVRHLDKGDNMQTVEKMLLDTKELAALLGVSEKFVRTHTYSRRLPGIVKIGGAVRFNRLEIMKRLNTGKLLLDR